MLPFVIFVEPLNVFAEHFPRRRRKLAECLITVGIADRVITHAMDQIWDIGRSPERLLYIGAGFR